MQNIISRLLRADAAARRVVGDADPYNEGERPLEWFSNRIRLPFPYSVRVAMPTPARDHPGASRHPSTGGE